MMQIHANTSIKFKQQMNHSKSWFRNGALAFGLFFITLLCGPLAQLDGLRLMPGDIGDARLNNYFLENFYQFLSGRSNSLWHLGFFYPFPYVLGFSDNLFGSAPIYALLRFFHAETDTAFQLWFLFGYLVNYAAAYYALRQLGTTVLAASTGALIFTFALPVSAHAGHAQLHYRFGIPLALSFFLLFLQKKSGRLLFASGFWWLWQMYCGVYMGTFTLLLLLCATGFYFGQSSYQGMAPPFTIASSVQIWLCKHKWKILFAFVFFLGMLVLLFYPYIQVKKLYALHRSWGEISSMLPRMQSYFLADHSFLWSANSGSRFFSGIPMRHEQQMFMGAVPLVLALLGFLTGSQKKNGPIYTWMAGVFFLTVLFTLYAGGFSLWNLMRKLPLFSALRAMSRIDQVLLFPVAFFAAIFVHRLQTQIQNGKKLVLALIIPLLMIECSAAAMGSTSTRDSWRQRIQVLESQLPVPLPANAILFVAQTEGSFFTQELDAMWVALRHQIKTLNGYSGGEPPGFSALYGTDCTELSRRLQHYVLFSKSPAQAASYQSLAQRVIPLGFNCS